MGQRAPFTQRWATLHHILRDGPQDAIYTEMGRRESCTHLGYRMPICHIPTHMSRRAIRSASCTELTTGSRHSQVGDHRLTPQPQWEDRDGWRRSGAQALKSMIECRFYRDEDAGPPIRRHKSYQRTQLLSEDTGPYKGRRSTLVPMYSWIHEIYIRWTLGLLIHRGN